MSLIQTSLDQGHLWIKDIFGAE